MAENNNPLLPEGYALEQDQDGDWILTPPQGETIFSEPGEGFLIGACDYDTALADAMEHLAALSRHGEGK